MEKTVYLSLGSNIGDRAANLRAAIDNLGALGEIVAISSFYETEPVDFTAQPGSTQAAIVTGFTPSPNAAYDEGTITATSGANAGASRTIAVLIDGN